jgi:hypothetical protein
MLLLFYVFIIYLPVVQLIVEEDFPKIKLFIYMNIHQQYIY